jgi:hypothetical protein
MKKVTIALLLTFVLAVSTVGVASAIRYGEPDEGRHPYVGLMVALDEDGNPLWRCTGTLVSPELFITAGHCTDGATSVEIWFDEGPIVNDPNYVSVAAGGEGCADPDVTGYPCEGDASGTPYTHPDYDPNAFFVHDLGVVVLDDPYETEGGIYAELPALEDAGLLDEYETQRGQNSVTFTVVGYGLQRSFPDAAAWKNEAVRIRLVAYPRLIQINKGFLTVGDMSILVSNNANTGGLCFGDSGGPLFLEDTNLIVGVNSYVLNNGCAGTGGIYRIDQEDDLRWLYENFGQYM